MTLSVEPLCICILFVKDEVDMAFVVKPQFFLGTGKSSTISKYTGQEVAISKGASSLTRHCEIYANLKNPTGMSALQFSTLHS